MSVSFLKTAPLGAVLLLLGSAPVVYGQLPTVGGLLPPLPVPAPIVPDFDGATLRHGALRTLGGHAILGLLVPGPLAAAAVPTVCSTDHEELDQETNSRTTLAPLPQPTASAASTVGKDDLDYLIGGDNCSGTIYNTVYAYNRTTNSWTLKAPLPTARHFARAVSAEDGQIYVLGGTDASGTVMNTVEIYNVDQNSWTVGPPMNTARSHFGASLDTEGQIVVAGGVGTNGRTLASVETFQNGAWVDLPAMTTPRQDFGLAELRDHRLFAAGGIANGTYLRSMESIDPAIDAQWTPANVALPTARAKESVLEDDKGNLLVTDGQDSKGAPPDNTTYEFPLAPDATPHTVLLYLEGTNEFPLFSSEQMTEEQPLPTQSIKVGLGLLSQPSWISDFSLNGAFGSGAQFIVSTPCSVGLALATASVYTTDLDGVASGQPVAQAPVPVVCVGGSQVTTMTAPANLALINQRLKLVISSLVSVNPVLPAGTSSTFQATQFAER